MHKIFLNIGCGNCKLDGFINIDLEPTADMQLDVRNGLPFDDDSVNGIYSEHFIEHLTQSEAVAFLRECRRILKYEGILRISTPDLSNSIQRYLNNDWREKTNLDTYGFGWLNTPCEYLNTGMREWGYKWLYDETELVRLAKYAGFYQFKRCESGISNSLPLFNDLESRIGDFLIIEAQKRKMKNKPDNPLVSIFISAYNYRYFSDALESVLNQSYDNVEIIIGDDSHSEKIKDIVEIIKKKYPAKKIHYFREGAPGQGERKNFITCLSKSKGELIKPLYDDDLLEPRCVERMVKYINKYPSVTLVTSHRQLIDSEGRKLPDISATKRIVQKDALINGSAIVKALVTNRINFIGEPSTVMFRKEDLIDEYPDILSFAGRKPVMNGDVTIWMKLLSRGDCIYIAESLSSFRRHKEQAQQQPGKHEKGSLAWEHALFDAKRMGFFEPSVPQLSGQPLSAKTTGGKKTFSVSIIIPVFNQVEYTKQCLEALIQNTPDDLYEVIIVDNASTDGTKEFLKCLEGGVKIITNEENLGFAKACNQGAREASGKYLVFLNNDTVPQPGWLEEMIKVAEGDDNVGIVGSKLLFPDGTIQHAGVAIGRDRVPYHIFKGCDANDPRVNKLREFKIVTGACLLISRKLFMNVGMLDEEFINGHEDIDLCFKVREVGGKVIYCPSSILYHYESVSEGRMDSRKHNLERTFKKWGEKLVPDDKEYLQEFFCRESKLNVRKKKITKASELKFAIKIGTPDRSVKHWGDVYYAQCLLKALERAGCQGEIHYRNEWNTQDKDIDVVIHLRGLGVYEPKPYNINLMWLVSHPSLVTPEELENYDGILVASREYADILKRSLDAPVIYLPQATDPEHFKKIDTCSKEYDIVFIGNNYNGQAGRQIIKDLLSSEFDFKLWGKGWDGIVPKKFIMGDFVTWDELPLVYNKTRIVLNDHHSFMKMFGFVNNRTFDVAACGTFLISDKVENIECQIPVITYDNEKDLTSLIYYYLEHEQKRESKANEVKHLVVENFTFDQSVKQILDFLKKIEPVKSEKQYSIPEIGQSELLRFLEIANTCYELGDKTTVKQMLLQYTALLEKQGTA